MNKNIRILVVDDFSTMRRIVKNLLSDLGFNNTVEAEDGHSALAVLRQDANGLLGDLRTWRLGQHKGERHLSVSDGRDRSAYGSQIVRRRTNRYQH